MDDERTVSMNVEHDAAAPIVRRRAAIDPGRLTMYTGLGVLTGLVPLPWLPGSLAKRVRGAMVHDIAARHGLSLANDAREMLSEPNGPDGPRGLVLSTAQFVGMKLLGRFGPVGFIAPVRVALTTWALGHLFDRYLETCRAERAIRIDLDEARKLRIAIDRALVHALTSDPHRETVSAAPEELRDTLTQIVDGVLGAAAAIPNWLVRRIDAAFDELSPHGHTPR